MPYSIIETALIFCCLMLAACTTDAEPVAVTRHQKPVPTEVVQPSATTTPSLQPTALPLVAPLITADSTSTATALPSSTPSRTPWPTHTATVTPILRYDLPSWVSEPGVPVLLAEMIEEQDHERIISLFNLESEERWDLVPNPHGAAFAWVQSDGELFIELDYPESANAGESGETLVRIAITDGTISRWPPRPSGALSHDGRSFAQVIYSAEEPAHIVLGKPYDVDQDDDGGIVLVDPFEGRFDIFDGVSWSPDDAYIAVQRLHYPDNRDWDPLYGLAIYTDDGQLFKTLEGVSGWQWAPTDPPRLLHTIHLDGDSQVPCILDTEDGIDTCFESIERWREDLALNVYQFKWLPDGYQLSIITYYSESALCYLELSTENYTCMVEATDVVIPTVQFRRVLSHGWVGDSRHPFIILDPQEPGFDVVGPTYLAVRTADGQDFRVLGQVEHSNSRPLSRPSSFDHILN